MNFVFVLFLLGVITKIVKYKNVFVQKIKSGSQGYFNDVQGFTIVYRD